MPPFPFVFVCNIFFIFFYFLSIINLFQVSTAMCLPLFARKAATLSVIFHIADFWLSSIFCSSAIDNTSLLLIVSILDRASWNVDTSFPLIVSILYTASWNIVQIYYIYLIDNFVYLRHLNAC